MPDGATPTVEFMTICDYALIDNAGKLSIIGIFDRLFAGNFPALHPVLNVVSRWEGPPFATVESELRVWGPSKELVGTAQQHVELGEGGRSVGIIRLAPVPLPAPGEYVFELLGGGVSQRNVTMTVELIQPA